MLTRLITIRPSVRVHAKKDDFVTPADAPGEGKRRFPTSDELGPCEDPPKKKPNPIKKFLMKKFKIEEIDYAKFEKENKWAIRPEYKDKEP
tara:strand:+ start:1018 stop:1290 length:273 start_codon:yes stop_codon:yes gene_type:complete